MTERSFGRLISLGTGPVERHSIIATGRFPVNSARIFARDNFPIFH